jgi:hypothetical protein
VKSIRLEAANGSPIAHAIEGVFAAQGIAKEPCAPRCAQEAQRIAEKLETLGEPRLAALVEYNANRESRSEAVQTQFFPESRDMATMRAAEWEANKALRRMSGEPSEVGKFGERGRVEMRFWR